MIKVKLEYNPYKVETIVKWDDKPLSPGSLLDKISTKRLQEWIEEFPKAIAEEINTTDYSLYFHGTDLDFDDVEYAYNHSNDYKNIQLTQIKSDKTEDNKIHEITNLFDEIKKGPLESLKSAELKKAFEDALSNRFEASVVATMSSGKSTLINSLLGQLLMPAKQEACTAIVTKIIDDSRETSLFDAKMVDKNGQVVKKILNVTDKELIDWNDDSTANDIELTGNIPFVVSNNTKLVLVDTPGPNNSRNEDHSKKTYISLGRSAKTLIIYILNATQLSTNDDQALLRRIGDSMKSGGKKSRDRFIFVVNKLDNFKPGKDDIEGSLGRVKSYLEDMGIIDPNIFGTSAQNALELRTIMKEKVFEELDEENDDEYELKGKIRRSINNKELHFEKYSPLIPSHQRIIQSRLKKAREEKNRKEEALIHSGIPSVEEAINLYVNKYAIPQKIKTLVDTFNGTIERENQIALLEQSLLTGKETSLKLAKQKEIIESRIAKKSEKESFIKNTGISLIIPIKKTIKTEIDKVSKELDDLSTFEKDKMYSKKEAEEKYMEYIKIITAIKDKIEINVAELLTESIKQTVEELLGHYKKITAELFDGQNSENKLEINPIVLSGATEMSTSFDVNDFIVKENVVVGTKTVSIGKWYNPFSWFKEKEENITEEQQFMKATDFMMLFAPARAALVEYEKEVFLQSGKNQQNLNIYFQKEFEKFDKKILENLENLEAILLDKGNIDQNIKETSEKIIWINKIKNQMDDILAI
ncbi:MAG: dynamin family protein [Carnobacterium sp.]|nr:dynamin family protein [Carnobacterium sp.]